MDRRSDGPNPRGARPAGTARRPRALARAVSGGGWVRGRGTRPGSTTSRASPTARHRRRRRWAPGAVIATSELGPLRSCERRRHRQRRRRSAGDRRRRRACRPPRSVPGQAVGLGASPVLALKHGQIAIQGVVANEGGDPTCRHRGRQRPLRGSEPESRSPRGRRACASPLGLAVEHAGASLAPAPISPCRSASITRGKVRDKARQALCAVIDAQPVTPILHQARGRRRNLRIGPTGGGSLVSHTTGHRCA
jgi:hypothetical protein